MDNSLISKLANKIPDKDIFNIPFFETVPPYLTYGSVDALCHAVINSTADGDFFDKAEGCLLSALILYLKETRSEKEQTLGQAREILLSHPAEDLDRMFGALPEESEAKKRYALFKNALTNRAGAVLGLSVHLMDFWMLVSESQEGGD